MAAKPWRRAAAAAGGRLTLEAGAEHWYRWTGLDAPASAVVSARFERPKGATAAVPGATCVVRYQTGGGTVGLELRDGADAVAASAAGLASAAPALHALTVPAGLARGRLVVTLSAAPGAWARVGYYEITWL